MRYVLSVFSFLVIATLTASEVIAQQKPSLEPTPQPVTMPQLKNIEKLEGKLVQVTALVRHTDTAQVFTFGDKAGPDIHAIVPSPATDRAGEGAPFTGLKPAGRDLGPAIPAADKATEEGSVESVVKLLTAAMQEHLREHFNEVVSAKAFMPDDVTA